MLKQHKHDPKQKKTNHKKPAQICTCYELKVVLKECNEPVCLVAAGNNISEIADTLRSCPLCKQGFRRLYVLNCYYLLELLYTCSHRECYITQSGSQGRRSKDICETSLLENDFCLIRIKCQN